MTVSSERQIIKTYHCHVTRDGKSGFPQGSYRTDGARGWVKNWETGETVVWHEQRQERRQRHAGPGLFRAQYQAGTAAAPAAGSRPR